MGLHVDAATIAEWQRRGLIPADLPSVPAPAALELPSVPEDDSPGLVSPDFVPPGRWVIPVETRSLTNLRDWKQRQKLTKAARSAVSLCFGPRLRWLSVFAEAYHAGQPVQVTFTRLGGRRLDTSNLPSAIKPVEDALCLLMGADDGAVNWLPRWEQEPGGLMGVRVEFS